MYIMLNTIIKEMLVYHDKKNKPDCLVTLYLYCFFCFFYALFPLSPTAIFVTSILIYVLSLNKLLKINFTCTSSKGWAGLATLEIHETDSRGW